MSGLVSGSTSTGLALEFRILGPLDVRRDGRAVDLGAHRQRALLAVLLLSANEVLSSDRLIEEVWGERAPASAPNMIQVYVSRLRKALGPGLLLTQTPGYVLRLGEGQLDATRFASLVARAGEAMASGDPGAARALLEDALELWRGPPLADFTYDAFAQGEVARLEELRLEALELRIDVDLALGRHSLLVGELEQLIAQYPLRERLRGQLMLALYRSGRQGEALAAYRAARSTLVEQLGIEPTPGLQLLEQAILAQDPELLSTTNEREPVKTGNGLAAGNLAPELTSLIGRDLDVGRVAGLVADHRLVAVVGPGGVGKTRLAQRVAGNLASGFEGGAWFADLAAIDRSAEVASAVMSAIGLPDRPGATALDTVADELGTRRLLLVLDNCEHVLASAAETAGRLLRACPGVRILATSREPLAIPGERVERLEPLATTSGGFGTPAAVELFLDRAATHGVSWEPPEQVLDEIQQVCERLDGIPLAIELAAARTRAISPAELLAHLDDRLRLLRQPGHRSAPTRQQTLEATIAWSYDLLSAEDQATLRRLSVFHGGFSLAAAAAVCADIGAELDTLDRVTALVDRSVVTIQRRRDGDRYRLLESIGVFAQQRLRSEQEYEPTLDRHARFFLGLVRRASEQLRGPEQAAWAAKLDAEQDNLTAAVGWCLDGNGDPTDGAELAASLGLHWTHRGRSNVARRWLERALERGADVASSTLVSAHLSWSVLAYSTGDREDERLHATEAVAIARRTDDPELLAEALSQLALTSQSSGRSEEATALADELRSLQDRLSTPAAQIMARLGTAQVALAAGRPDQARSDASGARDIARRVGDFHYAALSGYWLAYAWALGSSVAAARATIAEAMDDAVRGGYQMSVADNLVGQTSLALADGDLETAWRLLPRTIEMLREQERWADLGTRLYLAAAIELQRDAPGDSAVLLGAALGLMRRLDFQDELLLPELTELRERLVERLGEPAFAEAHEHGAEQGLDDVVALISASEPGL